MIAQKITDIPYTNLLLLYFNFYIINFYLQRVARGLAMQSHYAISGIINTVVIAVTSMYLLVFLSFKTDGLLIAYAAGAVSSTVYLLIAINFPRLLSFTLFDKQLLKTLLVYSIPLLFDAIIWWTMNLSDRLILSYFKGNESVGLYSVANKFATLLTFLNHIFYLVWQEYAIINAKKEGKEKEFSEIFMQYIRVQFTGVILVMPIVKLFIDYFIDESFQSAYLFVPPLLFGAMFASFAAFYGLFYQIDKNTKGALFTSSIAGVLNIVLNVIMIPIYGIWAAAITTLLSFALLWVIRIAIFPSFLYKKNELLKHVLLGIVFTVIGLFAFYQEQLIVDVVNVILAGILFMYVNKTLLLKFLNKA